MKNALFALVLAASLSADTGCHNVKPDQFFEAVVDCAKINPETSAATSAAETCLVSAISGNPAACLSGLVTVSHFTVDEVACVVAWIAERENQKVAISASGPASLEVLNTAINWLVAKRIAIRNSYTVK